MLAIEYTTRTRFSVNGSTVGDYPDLGQALKALGEYIHPSRFSSSFRDRVADEMARGFSDRIRDTILHQQMPGAPALNPLTIAIKTAESAQRPASRLADKGNLLSRGLVVRYDGPGRRILMFRGDASTHSTEAPSSMQKVAALMEFGTRFQVTAKMARFFAAMSHSHGWPAYTAPAGAVPGSGVSRWITIPARPFMYPSKKRFEKTAPEIITRILDEEMAKSPSSAARSR